MRKLITVALVLGLGLLIPFHVSARSTPGGGVMQKPSIPRDVALQNPANPPQTQNDQCSGQDPQVQNDPCCGQEAIVIIGDSPLAEGKLRDVLMNYPDLSASTYFSNDGIKTFNSLRDRYELCFDIQIGDPEIVSTLSIVPNGTADQTKGLAAYGLKLRPDNNLPVGDPLVEINFPNAPVTLINSEISGNGDGPCVNLINSNGSVIRGGDIFNCSVGIRMENANNTLIGASDVQNYEQDKVLIHNNGIGIHLLSGDGNRWAYNSIYENVSGLYPEEPWKDGIVIDNEANGGIVPPTAKKQTESGGVLICEKDEEGKIVFRKMEFENVLGGGVISLYKTHRDYEYQGKDYIVECDVGTDGVCTLNDLPSWLNIPEEECGFRDLEVIAIYTTTRSSSYTAPMKFDGDSSVISIETDLPASTPGVVDERDITASGEEDDILSGGMSGDASGGGGAGPGMKCGGTLVPHATLNASALLHSLIWMTLPLLPVIIIRRRQHK